MFKEKAIKLLKDYFGFTTKEAENYYKASRESGEIDDIVKEIERYYKAQAHSSFLED